MEQIQNEMVSAIQTMIAQQVPKFNKSGDAFGTSEFQKLLDRAQNPQDVEQPQPARKSQTGSEQKTAAKTETKDQNTNTKAEEQAPVQEQETVQVTENPQAPALLPSSLVYVGYVEDDGTTQEILEFAYNAETGTWDRQMVEIQGRFVFPGGNVQGHLEGPSVQPQAAAFQTAADPKADAMLEATDPTVEHSPVEFLEQAADETFGKVMRQAVVETAQPQNVDDDVQVEVTDAGQTAKPLFHNVEAAPVKVGEAPAEEQSQAPSVSEQLTAPLANALAQGETRVTVHLNPEYLGSVEIEITQSANGVLRVALSASSSETRGLLEKHAANLQMILANRGQESVQVEVQRQEESQQGQNHSYDGHSGNQSQQQEQRRQHNPQSSEDFLQQLRLGLIPVEVQES